MNSRFQPTWDLDSIFPGGSGSPQLRQLLADLEDRAGKLEQQLERLKLSADEDGREGLKAVLNALQPSLRDLDEVSSFVHCLEAQDVRDRRARVLRGQVQQLEARFAKLETQLADRLREVPDDDWRRWLSDPVLAPLALPLTQARRRAQELLPPALEALVEDLSVDGYHAWGELYDTVVGRMSIPFEEDGRAVALSISQAANKLTSPDRHVRATVFARWEEAWRQEADLCAACLNHLGGYRLNLYRHRGWTSVLKEPLDISRIRPATLEAMWEAVDAARPRLLEYLRAKARLLGLDGLAWYDLSAPLGSRAKTIAYDEAAAFIIDQFARFDESLSRFAHRAFAERWIEAEDRPYKRPGGFCSRFPRSRQSRIFLTFAGTTDNVTTLAHELGHAYHQAQVDDLPPLLQKYPMTLAETASTFAELIVSDAALDAAADRAEQLSLLDERLQRTVAFFMNIRARFLFETRFYAERESGPVDVERLNELMVNVQREAYGGALTLYHPLFWASKLHFYITHVPFYNFPYTFGFLFSAGLYAKAREQGAAFAQRYAELLRDTGRMTVEQLAAKHLGVDLTRPQFWQEAAASVLADVDRFLALAQEKPLEGEHQT